MLNPITHFRQQKGLTQRELGMLLGICAVQVSQYETGAYKPDKHLEALAEIFETDPGTLKAKLEEYYEYAREGIRKKLSLI